MADPQLLPTPRASRREPYLWAGIVFGIGLLLTVGAMLAVRNLRRRADEERLARAADDVSANLLNRLADYEDLLRAGQGFNLSAKEVQPATWRSFCDSLQLTARHPGLKSLAYVARVQRRELPAFLAQAKAKGQPFDVHVVLTGLAGDPPPSLGRPDLFLIQYVEPLEPNRGGLGLDLGSSAVQREAAEAAAQSGEARLTGPLVFGDVGPSEPGIALMLPLYRGQRLPPPETRDRDLAGWVSTALLLRPLFEDSLRAAPKGFGLEALDLGMDGGVAQPATLFRQSARDPRAVQDLRRMQVGGRIWELHFSAGPAFYPVPVAVQLAVLGLGGLLVSASLSAAVWSLASTRARAASLARRMNRSLTQALQRYHHYVQGNPMAIIDWDRGFRITAWNPAAEQLFGYTEEEAMGRGPDFLVPESLRQQIRRLGRQQLEGEGGFRSVNENITKEGRVILCEWRNTPVRDLDGQILGFTSLAEDVTDKQRDEEALRTTQKLESLGVLAGGIAHDFNNLLAAILGHAQLAEAKLAEDHPARASLERVLRATGRASELARQMLAYAGRAPMQTKDLDFNALVRDMGDLLKVSAAKQAELRTELAEGLPWVRGDSAQLQQVVLNLVTNASDALSGRPGTITLRTLLLRYSHADLEAAYPGQPLDAGDYVVLQVRDDGSGMDAATMRRIFDPFFTTKFTGRGLGLSAILGIVRGHRGGIRVESRVGEGTTFTLVFPASTGEPSSQQVPKISGEWRGLGQILVADDEADLRGLMKEILEQQGFVVLEAEDGERALELYRAQGKGVALAILDMTMPKLGGLEVLKAIRELNPRTRVLLSSGYSEEEILRSSDLRPNGFLQKPFRMDELKEAVRRVLRISAG